MKRDSSSSHAVGVSISTMSSCCSRSASLVTSMATTLPLVTVNCTAPRRRPPGTHAKPVTPSMIARRAQPDPADEIAKLADLRDRGALTEAEFEAQKKKVLGT
jgi:hypothetical protein